MSVSYGRLAAAVVDAGRHPRRRVMDLLIAATAHAHGARLVAARPAQWRAWDEVADLFRGPGDPDWERDRDLVDADVRDPWAAR